MVNVIGSASSGEVFAGIDWGGTYHQVCVLAGDGTVRVKRRVRHDVDGLRELDAVLATAGENVRVAIERGEGLLVEHLQAGGHEVFCISPKISARARERYRLAATKSDAFDAFVLADTLRHEHARWRALSVPSPLAAELRVISRDRERVLRAQRAVESQLRAALESYHPAPLHLFSAVDRDITLAFLSDYPNPESASRLGQRRMEMFCTRHGYSGRTAPGELAARLQTHLLTASPGTSAGAQFSTGLLTEHLALLNAHLRAYDRRLDQLLAEHPDAAILRSFPGIGPVIAGVLIAEMGEDRSRFPTPASLLAEAGLAPVTRASGRMRQVRFRYAANHRLRHAVDWWMFVAAREDEWTHHAYETATAAGQGKFRALRGIGARWTRILWRAWTDHTPYDPARHRSRDPKAATIS